MKVSIVLVSVMAIVSTAPTTEEGIGKELAPSFADVLGDEQSELGMEDIGEMDMPPDPVAEDQNSEINRKKKSATTTFCVEVKPNNPFQKPYELCESGNEIYAVPAVEGHYSAPASAPAPAPASPVYGPPQKAYAPSSGYVQSSPAHNAAYKASTKTYAPKKYRANEDSTMDDNSEEESGNEHMRSAYGYGGSDYGAYGNYGGGMVKFIGAEDKKLKKKGHGHSGVVITCQPNLAGYASPVQAGAYGGAYRSSNQEDAMHTMMKTTEEPRVGAAYGYRHQPGGMSASYGGYGYGMIPSRPVHSYSAPAPAPSPSYSAPPPPPYPVPAMTPSYPAPSMSYSAQAGPHSYPVPAPAYPAPPPHPAPAPYSAPAAHATAAATSYGYAAPAAPAPSSGPSGYAPSFKPQQHYSPPGTYRNADDEDKMKTMQEDKHKEMRTMETMKKMADWSSEMRSTNTPSKKSTPKADEKMAK